MRGSPWDFVTAVGIERTRTRPLPECQKVWKYKHNINTGRGTDGQTDLTLTASHSAYVTCWCIIKICPWLHCWQPNKIWACTVALGPRKLLRPWWPYPWHCRCQQTNKNSRYIHRVLLKIVFFPVEKIFWYRQDSMKFSSRFSWTILWRHDVHECVL